MKIAENHFGSCPECGETDGYLNAGRSHVFFCVEHKTKWFAGANLFSSWRDETEEEQRKKYEERRLDGFCEVDPLPEGTPVFQRGLCLQAITNEIWQYAGRIVSAGLTAIRKAGDHELHDVEHGLATTSGYFTNDAGMDAVAKILFEAIGAEIKRREKRPDVNMWFSQKSPSWLRALVEDAVSSAVKRPNGAPAPRRKDDGVPF